MGRYEQMRNQQQQTQPVQSSGLPVNDAAVLPPAPKAKP